MLASLGCEAESAARGVESMTAAPRVETVVRALRPGRSSEVSASVAASASGRVGVPEAGAPTSSGAPTQATSVEPTTITPQHLESELNRLQAEIDR